MRISSRRLVTPLLVAALAAAACDSSSAPSTADTAPADGADASDDSAPVAPDAPPDTAAPDVDPDAPRCDTSPLPAPAPHPLLRDGFMRIAHRGGGALAPEATMAAYENAAAIGVDVLECDAHATSDGVVVCIHDESVNRTTDGTGLVRAMTFDALRALDAGYQFTPDGGATFPFRGQGLQVPTLAELLAAFPEHAWAIEIKQAAPSIVDDVVAIVREAGRERDIVLASFDEATTLAMRAAAPEIETAMTIAELVRFANLPAAEEACWVPAARFVQSPQRSGPLDVLSPAALARARRHGVRIHLWTVNDRADMDAAIERGADGIFTDDPAALREVLEARGAWRPAPGMEK